MSAVPKSTEEIEQAIFEENRQLRVNVSGIVNYIDACNFYGHAYAECKKYPERYMLIQYEFPVATVDQIREIPRFANLKYKYLIETLPNFIKCNNESLKEQLKIGFKQAFCDEDYKTMNESVLYNKMVKILGIINNVVSTNIKYVIYYGKMNDTDKKIMSILKEVSSLGILIMCPDKSVNNNIVGIDTLELPNSTEMFDMPTMDKRSKATTIAAAVQGKVNNTLYSGDVLGMYKPGQFRFAKSIPFVTTYDEIEMWWNKPLYLRPGFSANGDTATMPTMFKIIKGVHRDTNWYISSIRKLCCGKTIAATSEHDLCVGFINRNTHVMVSHGVDVNGTLYREQVPLYNSKYELNIKNIKQDKNYQYNILANNKQDMILSAINEIISSETIAWQKDFKTKEEFVTLVLNLLLNLSYTVLDMLQWFEYYTYNPNLILYLNTNSVINTQSAVIIEFARLMGFDIAIFIPNGYMLIEQKIQKDVYMDIYTIGETSSQINIGRLEVTSNIEIQSSNNQSKEKKKSLFSKLFG
jgi:hypothetical protein